MSGLALGSRSGIELRVARLACMPQDAELLGDLDQAFSNHHPEEICVASYTLLTSLVDLVRREQGETHVQALLGALEHPTS